MAIGTTLFCPSDPYNAQLIHAPALSEEDHHKLREALHALAAMLVRTRNTEKTGSVVEKPEAPCQGRSKRRPLWRSKREPVDGYGCGFRGRRGAEA